MKSKALEELSAAIVSPMNTAVADMTLGPRLSDRKEQLDELKKVEETLNKAFKTTNSIVRLGDKVGAPVPSIRTNLPSIDWKVVQCGGIPRGRIIEIFGAESSGKTTIALHIIGQEQKYTGDLCAIVDAEHAIDPTWAAKLGVDVDNLLISQPDSGEQALETVEALIKSRAVSLIVVDSVAALVPQAELDGDMGDSHMGLQARLMSQAMRKLRGICAQTGITVIFINQIREKIGVMFGSPETTPGGRALKFQASVRLDVRRIAAIKDGDVQVGQKMRVKVVKNKFGAPFREAEIDLYHETGIDYVADWVNCAVTEGIIEKSGSWYSLVGGDRLGQGLSNTVESLKSNPDVFLAIQKKVLEILNPSAAKGV